MCGRFTLTVHHLAEVAEALDVVVDAEDAATYRPRYNVAPGNRHWIVRSELVRRELVPATWGLVNSWARDPAVGFRQINARAETLATKPAWRNAFRSRRCLVPADGFFEWTGKARDRWPTWFHAPDRSVMWLAGLWESWTSPETGEPRTTFTIVTRPAVEPVVDIHHRMPVIVPTETVPAWLDGPDPSDVLAGLEAPPLVAVAVSQRVNSPSHDDPACLEPASPAVAGGRAASGPRQGSLF